MAATDEVRADASIGILREMRLIPADEPATMQMLVAIGLPLVGGIATQIAIVELVQWLAGTLI